jgi:hypothetical protein
VPIRTPLLAVALATVLGEGPAGACPLCISDTGKQVREGIFERGFARNLAVTVAPFAVIAGLVPLVSGALASPRRGTGREERRPELEKGRR